MGKRSALLRRAGTETASQFYSYETALRISGQGPVNKTPPMCANFPSVSRSSRRDELKVAR